MPLNPLKRTIKEVRTSEQKNVEFRILNSFVLHSYFKPPFFDFVPGNRDFD